MTRKKTKEKVDDSKAPPIKMRELGEHIRRRRVADGLSLRDAARQVGVGASTLWRLENGQGLPDSATLARLAQWSNVPLERFMDVPLPQKSRSVAYYPSESTPDIVEAHLRADRNLSPQTAKALAELFRVAYHEFTRKEA
jgi:transcriptional regulator with XRE-family HTH domain